jgi:DNA-binding NarL/FixJ family response regulator
VAIVDDHQLARAALRNLLHGAPALDIVGEATNGREALAMCRDLRPDLVLVDIHMAEMDGLAFTRTIKDESPGIKVVIVTMDASPSQHLVALRLGADGFLLKGATRREILRVIRGTMAAEPMVRVELAGQALRLLAARIDTPGTSGPAPLTPRQHEVLRLLADGQRTRAIGRTLHIKASTVREEVEAILGRLSEPEPDLL